MAKYCPILDSSEFADSTCLFVIFCNFLGIFSRVSQTRMVTLTRTQRSRWIALPGLHQDASPLKLLLCGARWRRMLTTQRRRPTTSKHLLASTRFAVWWFAIGFLSRMCGNLFNDKPYFREISNRLSWIVVINVKKMKKSQISFIALDETLNGARNIARLLLIAMYIAGITVNYLVGW